MLVVLFKKSFFAFSFQKFSHERSCCDSGDLLSLGFDNFSDVRVCVFCQACLPLMTPGRECQIFAYNPTCPRGSGHLFLESVVLRCPDWASSVLSSRLLVLGLWSPLVGGFHISHFKNPCLGRPDGSVS